MMDEERMKQLEGDLQVARLQLAARVCSECPAAQRLAEAEAEIKRLRVLFRVNMLWHAPTVTHDEIDAILDGRKTGG